MREMVVIRRWFRNRREARFHDRKGMFSYPPGKQPGVQQADSQVRIGLTQ